jgi:RNA polymerase sigma-70 factor (ECF subfamily)
MGLPAAKSQAMSEPTPNTTILHAWIERARRGDRDAMEQLLRGVGRRLERLAQRMMKRFPQLGGWTQVDDILQNAQMRLLRALEHVIPESTRGFYGLAAEQIRRELLDMVRQFQRSRPAWGALPAFNDASDSNLRFDPPDHREDGDLERWESFHSAVDALPAEEREVVGLMFYHGWKRHEVAELFGIDERTVRRWWNQALERLNGQLRTPV